MMIKKEKENNYFEIEFWRKWLYADSFKKEILVEKLPFLKTLNKIGNTSEETRNTILAMQLNSFFKDLEQAVYQKIAFEEKNTLLQNPK